MNLAPALTAFPSWETMGRRSFRSKLDLSLAKFSAAFFLICGSRFLEFIAIGESVRLILLGVQILIAVYGIVISFFIGNISASIFSALLMISIPLSSYNFSIVSGTQFVPISGGDYFPIGLIAIISNVASDGNFEKYFNYIYKISIAYVSAYVVLWIFLKFGVIHPSETSMIVRASGGGGDRGLRLALMVSFVIYAVSVSTARIFVKINLCSVFNFITSMACLILSGSRLISLITFCAIIFYIFLKNSKFLARAIFAIFLIELALTTFLIADHSFNPFDLFVTENDRVGDVSAWARWRAVGVLNDLIPGNWLFGIGIPNGPAAYKPITHLNYIFPEDLGIFGVFVKYGILGYILYISICFLSFFMPSKVIAKEQFLKIGLRISCAVFCLYSTISPIFFSDGIIFADCILAFSFCYGMRGKNRAVFTRTDLLRVERTR